MLYNCADSCKPNDLNGKPKGRWVWLYTMSISSNVKDGRLKKLESSCSGKIAGARIKPLPIRSNENKTLESP